MDTELDLVASLGPFHLTLTGVVVEREATYDEWQAAIVWAQRVAHDNLWWLGALYEYGEARYGDKYSQVLESTGYAETTARNATYVHRAIPPAERRPALSFSHHQAVAPVKDPVLRAALLEQAEVEDLTVEQVRTKVALVNNPVEAPAPELWLHVRFADEAEREQFADQLRVSGHQVRLTEKKPAAAA